MLKDSQISHESAQSRGWKMSVWQMVFGASRPDLFSALFGEGFFNSHGGEQELFAELFAIKSSTTGCRPFATPTASKAKPRGSDPDNCERRVVDGESARPRPTGSRYCAHPKVPDHQCLEANPNPYAGLIHPGERSVFMRIGSIWV